MRTYNRADILIQGLVMRQRASVVLIVCFLILATSSLTSAAGPAPVIRQQPEDPQGQHGQDMGIKPDPDIEKKMAKQRIKDRYKDLKRDSEKLLELATELKQQVDKSGENVLSMDVVKKCEEIEKLSKSVRSKMKGD